MTYFGFLATFVVPPILLLWLIALIDHRRGVRMPLNLTLISGWTAVATHVLIAVAYTTPWDNYLVATGVWWYEKSLVTGLTLGFVPIEEYTFFVLQVLLTGSWLLLLMRRVPPRQLFQPSTRTRWVWTAVVFVVWLIFATILLSGWKPGTYLGLLMTWALLPVMIQTAFGADILWHHRRIVVLSILPMTAYLAITDKLAISAGTWTIDPIQSLQSLGIILPGKLPLEELLFFLMTNILIVFGCTLILDVESRARTNRLVSTVRGMIASRRDRGVA
ncbi:MAG: lycopene cyclase domain-containing protein [Anaerolineae bacterium]|nr:lycopene cyclase domain-containing protein [Anaerolineae bacterium]